MTWLQRLNSLTKYPSIPPYHEIGDRGVLQPGPVAVFSEKAIVTEKIDGTNARIIFDEDYYYIGSRERLLTASGDMIANPALGICEALKPAVARLVCYMESGKAPTGDLLTFYFEVFGGNIGRNAKQYTSQKETGFRLFDVSLVDSTNAPDQLEDVALWRKNGGQQFLSESMLQTLSLDSKLSLTPRVANGPVPHSIAETHEWLGAIMPQTCAALDPNAEQEAEGVVVRALDRNTIVKIRFKDYERWRKINS